MPNDKRPFAQMGWRYRNIDQRGEWREAIEAYYWDRLPEALERARSIDVGGGALIWYRMIEGEALTREAAKKERLSPTMSIEFDESDIHFTNAHVDAMLEATETVARRLNWQFEMDVLATILIEAVDAPWHGARDGYCVDKYPYDKICIPRRAAVEPSHFAQIMRHEFTHVITLNLTENKIPRWLDEGIAMLMEGRIVRATGPWLGVREIDAAFGGDRREETELPGVVNAYAQASLLVRELHAREGDEGLAKLLRAFTNNSMWTEFRMRAANEPSVEEALYEVYGIGQKELFAAVQSR